MHTLVFATGNAHKLSEVQQIIGDQLRILSLPEIGQSDLFLRETSDTLHGNAIQKALTLYHATERDCFAEDTGLEVDALSGEPGVFTARYAGPDAHPENNIQKLLQNLEGTTERSARFRTVIALILQKALFVFEGTAEGKIADQPSGQGGFGYDPVFIPHGYDDTFAQLSAEVKNTLSHRAMAIKHMMTFLREICYI